MVFIALIRMNRYVVKNRKCRHECNFDGNRVTWSKFLYVWHVIMLQGTLFYIGLIKGQGSGAMLAMLAMLTSNTDEGQYSS